MTLFFLAITLTTMGSSSPSSSPLVKPTRLEDGVPITRKLAAAQKKTTSLMHDDSWWWGDDNRFYPTNKPDGENWQNISLATVAEVPAGAELGERYVPRCRNSRIGYHAQANDQFRRVSSDNLWRRGLSVNVTCPTGAVPQEEWEVIKVLQKHLRDEATEVRESRIRAQRQWRQQQRQQQHDASVSDNKTKLLELNVTISGVDPTRWVDFLKFNTASRGA